MSNQRVGQKGEDSAVIYLKKAGYVILERNYRNRWGEIDVIAKEGNVICFIEVKARADETHGSPFEAVTPLKQRKIMQVAQGYLMERSKNNEGARFDVIAVTTNDQGKEEIHLVRDAFELEDF